MMTTDAPPLVSILCLCYNQAAFVADALAAVKAQTYPHWELLIADDASTDGSAERIAQVIADWHKEPVLQRVFFEAQTANKGHCTTFNALLAKAKGKYIVDLAADDWFTPTRIANQVAFFDTLSEDYGLIFSNAALVDAQGRLLRYHYPINADGRSRLSIPQGWVYEEVLRRYFICTPTMMMRHTMLQALGGYDATLSYEDFDLWVRSSPNYAYAYLDEITTYKRQLQNAASKRFYFDIPSNRYQYDTWRVCRKAQAQNQTPAQNTALAQGARYYLRLAFYTRQWGLVRRWALMLRQLEALGFLERWICWAASNKVSVHYWYRLYLRWRYGQQ
ncbi:glycosyltransferase [Eisenibacter elegans]|uniref:glycosyltransferase n=1 Tax=Eisenibacter elegans TaxID=997 RepID=UPI00041CC5D0|nr:glycosyltransferase [Eisenibacter elegans]